MKLLLLLMLTAIGARGQDVMQTLNRYLDQASRNHEFNGNILLAQDGKVLYKKSYGYRDIANQIPLNDSALFPLASISKTFTAVAVLQLMEKGKLKLDDTYQTYFPEFPYPAITIRQLLSHTSGLPDLDVLYDSSVAHNAGIKDIHLENKEKILKVTRQVITGLTGKNAIRADIDVNMLSFMLSDMQVMILNYAQMKYRIDFRENIRAGKPLYSIPDKEMLSIAKKFVAILCNGVTLK
jgi:hypothetical protein